MHADRGGLSLLVVTLSLAICCSLAGGEAIKVKVKVAYEAL